MAKSVKEAGRGGPYFQTWSGGGRAVPADPKVSEDMALEKYGKRSREQASALWRG